MLRTANLVRVSSTSDSGRNKPIRGGIRVVTDQNHDAYIKPAGWHELTVKSAVNEYVSVCVAGLLNLPVCEPFWVYCPLELSEFCPIVGGKRLGELVWPAFSTVHAGTQWRTWLPSDNLNADTVNLGLGIFAFDAFLENPDRRLMNPNLLIKGNEFRMIDHEFSFSFTELISFLQTKPWAQNSLDWMTEGDSKHILYSTLRRSANIDFNFVKLSWAKLSDEDLNSISNGLPAELNTAIGQMHSAIQRVKDVRDNIDDCTAELERILS